MTKPISYTQDLKARGFTTERSRMTLLVDPRALIVEGVDTAADDSNPLFDPRAVHAAAKLQPYFDPTMVDSMRDNPAADPGDPIQCVVRNGKLTVKDGRRRTIHYRFAKVEKVEVVIDESEGLDDKALFLAVRAANARRLNPSAIMQARECMRARKAWGCTVAEFAANEGLSEPIMRQRMSLLYLAPSLQDRTDLPEDDKGHLPFSIGIQLSKIWKGDKSHTDEERHAKQIEIYERLVAADNLTTAAVRREKSALNGDTEGGTEGAEEPGGDEEPSGDEEPTEKSEKTRGPGLTMGEVRKILKAAEAGELEIDPIALRTLKIIAGEIKPGAVKGMTEAFNKVRGA